MNHMVLSGCKTLNDPFRPVHTTIVKDFRRQFPEMDLIDRCVDPRPFQLRQIAARIDRNLSWIVSTLAVCLFHVNQGLTVMFLNPDRDWLVKRAKPKKSVCEIVMRQGMKP